MKDFIYEKLRFKANKYKDFDEAISSSNSERRIAEDYNGRQLLELLQNADDQIEETTQNKCVEISFFDDELTIYNNGKPFSKSGIKSLMYSDRSPKHNNQLDEIGCKGLGFRSVLTWADEITIDSGELHVRFSKEIAKHQLKNLLPDNYLKKINDVSTLEFPEWNDDYLPCEYETRIKLRIKKEKEIIDQINNQINDLDGELLLFLNHTTILKIKTKDKNISFEKEYKENKQESPTLLEYKNEKLVNKDDWCFLTKEEKCKDDDGIEKRYRVSLAWKKDGSIPKKQVIYCYFPTKVSFNFPFLVHATFELNSNRNNLVKKTVNKEIVKTIAKQMVKLAIRMRNKNANYEALWMLLSNWDFPLDLKEYDIEDILLEEIKGAKLFPNINNKYVSLKDYDLVYDKYNLGDYIQTDDLNDLLKNYDIFVENKDNYLKEKRFENKFKQLIEFESYDENYLSKIINKYIKDLKLTTQNKKRIAGIAISIYKYDDYKSENFRIAINKDNIAKLRNKPIFIKDDKEISNPPEFLKYDFLDKQYFDFLKKRIHEEYITEDSFFEWMGLDYMDIKSIINSTNTIIEKEKNKKFDETKVNISKFINWLWHNKKSLKEIAPIKTYLISRDNKIVFSDELYYGKEYDNSLIEELLKNVKDIKYIEDIKSIINEETNSKAVIEFLEMLGVNGLPKKMGIHKEFYYSLDFSNEKKRINSFYCKELISQFPTHDITLKNSKHTYETRESAIKDFIFKIPITEIENIDEILSTADTKAILDWILKDEELKNLICGERKDNASSKYKFDTNELFLVRNRNSTRFEVYNKLKKSKSYMSNLFENAKWISINEERYSVKDCVLNFDYGDVFKPIVVGINGELLDNKSKSRQKKYNKLFEELGIVDNIVRLPYEKIYGVLDILPTVDDNGKYAKSLYNTLVKSDKKYDEKDIGNFDTYIKFKDGVGKLYTNHGYIDNKNVYYLNNEKEINKKIKDKYNIIALPSRLNISVVKKIFRIDKLKIKTEIIGEPIKHDRASEFNEFLLNFKQYAFCYKAYTINDETVIRNYCNFKVTLCSYIKAKYNDDIVELDDYEYVKRDDTYFLKYPEKNQEKFYSDKNLGEIISDIICSLFNSYSESEKLRLLFLCKDKKEQEEEILKNISDESIFKLSKKKLNMVGSTKEDFYGNLLYLANNNEEALKQCNLLLDSIDYEKLNSEKNIGFISKCLINIGKDICDYNNLLPAIEIDFTSFYKKQVNTIIEKYKSNYKSTLYENLKNKTIEEKKQFQDMLNDYDGKNVKIENSVYYNAQQAVLDTYEIELNDQLDVDSIYFNNEKSWLEGKEEKVIAEEIAKQNVFHSLLYFGDFEVLDKEYKEKCSIEERKNSKPISRGTAQIKKDIEIEPDEVGTRKQLNSRKSSSVGYSNLSNKKAVETGRSGEAIVYETLKNKGVDVVWVSENAYSAGVNSDGKAGLGYDMFIKSETGIEYIEVKSSSGNQISFKMSDSEYDFACQNCDHYSIYFVENINGNPIIKTLESCFTKDGFDRRKGDIEIAKEYHITAKEK